MIVSQNGLIKIQYFEGFVDHAYPDANGFSIGFGTNLNTPELLAKYKQPDVTITRDEAALLMMGKIGQIEDAFTKVITVPLTQNQYDALASFTYNMGIGAFEASTMLKLLNQKNYQTAADEFPKWSFSQGKQSPGLLSRRNQERTIFLT